MAKKNTSGTHLVGRSAKSGQFIPITQANRHKSTTIVQRIKNPSPKKK